MQDKKPSIVTIAVTLQYPDGRVATIGVDPKKYKSLYWDKKRIKQHSDEELPVMALTTENEMEYPPEYPC